jgi:hypothetical protein
MSEPLPINRVVKPYGKIAAVGVIKGERYYWLVDARGDVSMMPADVVERRSCSS